MIVIKSSSGVPNRREGARWRSRSTSSWRESTEREEFRLRLHFSGGRSLVMALVSWVVMFQSPNFSFSLSSRSNHLVRRHVLLLNPAPCTAQAVRSLLDIDVEVFPPQGSSPLVRHLRSVLIRPHHTSGCLQALLVTCLCICVHR